MQKTLATLLLLLSALVVGATEEESAQKTLVWPDGTRYVGGVVEGKRSGKGTIFWQDGTRFVGQFENDMRNGPGTMILPDGTVYTGYFKDDELVDSPDSAPTIADDVEDTIAFSPPPEPTPPPATPAEDPYRGAEMAAQFDAEVTEVTPEVETALTETINLWRAAWSDRNVPQYLANYSEAFDVPGRQSRSAWESLRRSRLSRPSFIEVTIEYDKFELVEPNVVDVSFRQTYRSDRYSDVTDKTLRMRKEAADWKILQETSR